ncbi:MAG: hypothetical protein IJE14_06200 [Clostridia bacterium]|nr:hypothetical protein [Clostridia bacterium]MBQ6931338.1 hypothetical protein [Clostridia bacterium]
MKKIIDYDVYGLLPVEGGFLYIKPEVLPDGNVKGSFWGCEAQSSRNEQVTKWSYFQNKFGPAYKAIAGQVTDYISCETGFLSNNHTVVLYPDGDLGVFNSKGAAVWTGELKYNGAPVRGVAVDGKNFWSVVPELNAVICYATDEKRVQMRIGGGKSTAFLDPSAIVRYNDMLYVCSRGANKVRTISLANYAVNDYLEFDEPVNKYFLAGGKEFVLLDSGLYEL